MAYSPLFQTLHDEKTPVGNLGRGTHYSVLRAVTWNDAVLRPLPRAAFLDFAVVWDEDHDTRVVDVVHALYFDGLLAPVRFIGERKGGVSVLLDPAVFDEWPAPQVASYRERVVALVQQSSDAFGDQWSAQIDSLSGQQSIISDDDSKTSTYLSCVLMLWDLGIKPTTLPQNDHAAA